MKKARSNNPLLNHNSGKQRNKLESQLLQKQLTSGPAFSLPTEPDPPEMLRGVGGGAGAAAAAAAAAAVVEEQQAELWGGDGDASQQSGGSEYEINQEMYEGNDDENMYSGNQVKMSL